MTREELILANAKVGGVVTILAKIVEVDTQSSMYAFRSLKVEIPGVSDKYWIRNESIVSIEKRPIVVGDDVRVCDGTLIWNILAIHKDKAWLKSSAGYTSLCINDLVLA